MLRFEGTRTVYGARLGTPFFSHFSFSRIFPSGLAVRAALGARSTTPCVWAPCNVYAAERQFCKYHVSVLQFGLALWELCSRAQLSSLRLGAAGTVQSGPAQLGAVGTLQSGPSFLNSTVLAWQL